MKKKLLFFLLISNIIYCQNSIIDTFMIKDPKAMMMGEAMTANSERLNPFFYNPAGFARKKNVGRIEALGIRAWFKSSKRTLNFLYNAKKLSDAKEDNSDKKKEDHTAVNGREETKLNIPKGIQGAVPTDLADQINIMADYDLHEPDEDAKNETAHNVLEDAEKKGLISEKKYKEFKEKIENGESVNAKEIMLEVDVSNPDNAAFVLKSFKTHAAKNTNNPAIKKLVEKIDPKSAKKSLIKFYNLLEVEANVSLDIAWAGRGFGLGLFANTSLFSIYDGSFSNPALRLKMGVSVSLAGGYGFNVFDYVKNKDGFLAIGFTPRLSFLGYMNGKVELRSVVKKFTNGNIGDIVSDLTNNTIYYGVAFNLDLGLLYDIKYGITFGFALKNILPYPRFLKKAIIDNIFDGFYKGKIISESELNKFMPYRPTMSFGFQYHPDLKELAKFVDPMLAIDYQDFIGSIADKNFVNHLKFGASLRLLEHITTGIGYSNKSLTFGVGVDIMAVDLDFAFTYGKNSSKEDVFGYNLAILFKWDFKDKNKT